VTGPVSSFPDNAPGPPGPDQGAAAEAARRLPAQRRGSAAL